MKINYKKIMIMSILVIFVTVILTGCFLQNKKGLPGVLTVEVSDGAAPLENLTVTIPDLNKTETTNSQGIANFGELPPKVYEVILGSGNATVTKQVALEPTISTTTSVLFVGDNVASDPSIEEPLTPGNTSWAKYWSNGAKSWYKYDVSDAYDGTAYMEVPSGKILEPREHFEVTVGKDYRIILYARNNSGSPITLQPRYLFHNGQGDHISDSWTDPFTVDVPPTGEWERIALGVSGVDDEGFDQLEIRIENKISGSPIDIDYIHVYEVLEVN